MESWYSFRYSRTANRKSKIRQLHVILCCLLRMVKQGLNPGERGVLPTNRKRRSKEMSLDASFRPLKTHERELLEKLLEPEFPGREELRQQLNSVTAKQVFENGTLALQCGLTHPAPVKSRVPVEGECRDADGGPISV